MTQSTRLFRIFVSSTFADMTAERNILQQKTFPALREYCQKKGVEFQAIDLRWGVSEEASLDQQTMNICLGEIRRCQALTPRPNFLVLLGQRYGWVPPPPQIPAKDFDEMSNFWSKEDRQLVETWYRRDDNVVPPAYVLLPRTGSEDWTTIEQRLVSALGQGARSARWQGSRLLPYCASATHQEIAAGALEVDTPAEKVLCVFRDLEVPASAKNEASVYCDLNTTAIEELRRELTQALPDENILRVQAAWDAASQAPATTHLQAMADGVYERLRRQIDQELETPVSVVPEEASQGLQASEFLDDEGQQHLAFARKHLEHFVGRSAALAEVNRHLQNHEGRMLVVQGAGGSGKTAFLSRVLQGIGASHPEVHVVVRFIGTTPDSSGSLALLQNLCRELARRNGTDDAPVDGDYPSLSQEFRKRLETFPHPLVLALDALDQLPAGDPGRTLGWLPQELGPAVRLIVSTRPDETEDLFRYRKTQMLAFDGLLTSEGQELLEVWLQAAGRTLQPRQWAHVINQFLASGRLPLYLRLAFEEARRWKSWVEPETLAVGIPELLQHNFFDRLASDQHHGHTLISRTLAYLAASRHGLSESELHDLLSRDVEVYTQFLMGSHHLPADLVAIAHDHATYQNQPISSPTILEHWQALRDDLPRLREALKELFSYRAPTLPVVLLARLRADLEPYLTTRSFDDTLLMGFYHRELAEVASNTFLVDQAGLIHAHLAKYFERQADPESLGMWLGSKRYLRELPHHLIQAQNWSRLAGDEATPGVLTDLRFIQSKCTAGLTHDLVGDYNRALDLIPGGQDDSTPSAVRLRHFSNFVSHHLGVLSEYPAETLPIAVNYADSGPVVSQAERLLDEGKVPHLRRNPRPPLIPLRPACLMVLNGHKNGVYCVAVTPDGKEIVSGGSDRTVRVWKLENGECIRVLGVNDVVHGLSLSNDGDIIISCGQSFSAWNFENGDKIHLVNEKIHDITCISCVPDSNTIIIGNRNGQIQFWDTFTGDCLRKIQGHGSVLKQISKPIVYPDKKNPLARPKFSFRPWRNEFEVMVPDEKFKEEKTNCLFVTTDGNYLISGSSDKTIRVWDLKNLKCIQILELKHDCVCVAVTPDGKRIVSGGEKLTVWNLETGKCLKEIELEDNFVCVAVTPDGKRIISGGRGKVIRVWDLENVNCIKELRGHGERIHNVIVTPDGKRIISGSEDGNIRIWEFESGECQKNISYHDEYCDQIAITQDGNHIVSAGWDCKMQVWDLKTGSKVRKYNNYKPMNAFLVKKDGNLLHGRGNDAICVFPLDNSEYFFDFPTHPPVTSIIYSDDEKRIITGSSDDKIKVWDAETLCLLLDFDANGIKGGSNIHNVSKDANQIATWRFYGKIHLWNIHTGETERELDCKLESGVAISPDRKKIVTGSLGNKVCVWDIETNECLNEFCGHKGAVIDVKFTSDGKLIISGGEDKNILIWNAENGCCLCCCFCYSSVLSLALSPRGDCLVAGTADGQIHILTPVNFTLCDSLLPKEDSTELA